MRRQSRHRGAGWALVLAALVLVAAGVWWSLAGQPVGGRTRPQLFTIRAGETAGEVAAALGQRHLVRSALYVRLLSGLTGASSRLKAGVYLISPDLTPARILQMLVRGQVATRRLTVPEGFTVRQIASRLGAMDIVSSQAFLAAAMTYHNPYLPAGAQVLDPAEGYLFPTTYDLPYGISAKGVLTVMLAAFNRTFTPSLRNQAKAMGLSINQVTTLASMVQREAFLAKDVPLVAAVFLNRLHAQMALGSDATISYALNVPGNQLTRTDLASGSPYNTLHRLGLPPGPISNPGLAAILAVLHPAPVSYLYFFSLPDGQEIFSNTYAEQEQALKAAGY